MSFLMVYRPVEHSRSVYSGIKCDYCRKTSYCLDDIEARRCPFCHTTHSTPPEPQPKSGRYALYKGKGRKSKKVHWSSNGIHGLCTTPVGSETSMLDDAGMMCANCRDLRARGFDR